MINILLFGPPGAGKGTQAEFIVKNYSLTEISTGAIIREEVAKGSDLGKMASIQMQGGGLAADDIVIGIIDNHIKTSTNEKGNIFDGFPRTLIQAEELDKILEKAGSEVSALISLEVPREVLLNRMIERGKMSGRSDDQSHEVMENRIDIYFEKTKIVKEHYKKFGKCFEVDGCQSIEMVTKNIDSIISTIK